MVGGGLGPTAAAADVRAPAVTAATTGSAGWGKAPALASGTHTIQSSGQTRSYILELASSDAAPTAFTLNGATCTT